MLHRLQLGPRRTSESLQTRVEFPLHDNSIWGMERHSTKWPRFLQQRKGEKPQKVRSIFSDSTKGKHCGVGLQLSIFFAILSSDSIGTTLGATIRKEVDDLRQVRNDIAHINEDELTDVEFQNYVARVIAAFTSLKLSTDEVEDVKNQTSFPTAEVNSLKLQAGKLKADLKAKDEEDKI